MFYLIDEEGRKSQACQIAGQMLISVPVIVFEMVALCFQCIECFVFNFSWLYMRFKELAHKQLQQPVHGRFTPSPDIVQALKEAQV